MADESKPAGTGAGSYPPDVIARLLLITPRRLQQLAADGVIPKAARGKYDLIPCVQGYVRSLQQSASGRGDGELSAQRARLAQEQADKVARENAIARGEIIPKAEVVATWQTFVAHCRARLLAIPTKAAPLVAAMTAPGPVKEKLTELVHEALDELSRTRGVPEGAGRRARSDGVDGGGADIRAAAEPDGQRVGRPVSGAKSGGKRRAG